MIADLPLALVAAGVTTAYGYPGYPADELLVHIERARGIELVVVSHESAAVAAAHAHWMVTGRPTALVLSDVAGVEAAVPMLALAAREGAGLLVLLPGRLPGKHRSGELLEALGATVVDFNNLDVAKAAGLAEAGQLVAAIPGHVGATTTAPISAGKAPGHRATIIGPRTTHEQLRALEAHTCSLITTAGVQPPRALLPRWLGPLALAAHPGVFRVLGFGDADGTTVAAVGCQSRIQEWLQSVGADSTVVPISDAGDCQQSAPCLDIDGAEGLPLFEALVSVAVSLPGATLVSDAGACHRISAYAARRANSALVSTFGPTSMGWGPGAALGAGLATGAPVILTIGDGSLAMAGLQLLDWGRYGVAGVIVAAHNGSLGSVLARVGRGHPRITDSAMAPAPLMEMLGIPWRGLSNDGARTDAVAWAAGVASAGGRAALVVDTTGQELLDYQVPAGLPWWDSISRASKTD